MTCDYGTETLAAGGLEAVAGLRITARQANQPAALFRAQQSTLLQRGQRAMAIEFSVTRAFADLATAEAFVHDHADDLPASGALVFGVGTSSAERTYAAAVLEGVSCQYLGLSVIVTYQFAAKANPSAS